MGKFAEPEKIVLLALESHEHPMHLGVLQMFRPPAGAGPEYPRETYEAMRACTDVARTFTGHPSATRRGTSKVRWTYDSGIEQLSIPVDQDLLRGLLRGRFVGAFDVLAVLELHAGSDQRDQVRRVHGAPA